MNTIPWEQVERLVRAYGLPGEAERLRAQGDVIDPLVQVWGAVGVDGEPPEATLEDLQRWERLVSSPALAVGLAVSNWAPFRAREGLWDAAVRAGREVLARDSSELARPDDQALVDRLGREIQTQAARFLEGLTWPEVPREPAGWGAREALPWCEAAALAVHRRSLPHLWWRAEVGAGEELDAARDAWLREREAEEPASLVDGVPWLSWQLARFLRDELRAAEIAEGWLERERERTAEIAHPELPMGQGPACVLPGWLHNVAKHLSSPGPGVSAATYALALTVWWRTVRPELELELERKLRTTAPALVSPMRQALTSLVDRVDVHSDARTVLSGSRETRLAMAPGIELEAWRGLASTLHTVPARRAVAWLSRAAWLAYLGGDRGHDAGAWWARKQTDGSVLVHVQGGLDGLGHVIGGQHKDAGREVYEAMQALSGVVLSAETSADAGMTAPLVQQVSRTRGGGGRPGTVSCTLSPWWVPGAVHALTVQRERVIVPVIDVPPFGSLSRQFYTLGAAMEERALIELATHSREVEQLGGVALDWRALAGDLPWQHAEPLLATWQREGRWVEHPGGRWMLGECDDDLRRAGELIRRGGALREHRAKGGRARVDASRGKPRKRGGKR
jgi:hypothetical protein